MIQLCLFLGNPGSRYRKTRHNSGQLFLEHILPHIDASRYKEAFHGSWAQAHIASLPVIILTPHTFMNESGRSIQAASHYFGINVDEILVVHDDLELPFGTTKIQQGGGLGGHNGLRSIVQHLGSSHFFRVRIGIGRPQHQDVSSFVLSRFDAVEESQLSLVFDALYDQLYTWCEHNTKAESLPLISSLGK